MAQAPTLTPQQAKSTRTRLGYSQREFGDFLGYTKGYISNVEQGSQPITDTFEERWADVVPFLKTKLNAPLSEQVSVTPVGVFIHPGALVLVGSIPCGYIHCRRPFVPRSNGQRYCGPSCKLGARRIRRSEA
jgi:DNA-binding XRE family transcriptional regulator